jgi:undecaprenyl-diphosphatase
VLKGIFDRPRPDLFEMRGQHAWAAFPSGHAIASVSVLLTVAILLRRERDWGWPTYAAVALLLVSLYSRLYLGVHWPTDILGGVLVGLCWLAATLVAFRGPLASQHTSGAGEMPAPDHSAAR